MATLPENYISTSKDLDTQLETRPKEACKLKVCSFYIEEEKD